MKINFGKLLALVGRIVVAAPVIVAAVKPVIRPSTQPTVPPKGPSTQEASEPLP